ASLAVRARVQGTVAKPLDGGALSLRGTRTPAKGSAAAPTPSSGRHGWPPLRARLCARCGREGGGEKKDRARGRATTTRPWRAQPERTARRPERRRRPPAWVRERKERGLGFMEEEAGLYIARDPRPTVRSKGAVEIESSERKGRN